MLCDNFLNIKFRLIPHNVSMFMHGLLLLAIPASITINVFLTILQDFFSIIPWNLFPPTTSMTTPLDMSLEDVIKKNNREKLRARGRARRGRGAGGSFNGGRGVVIGSVRRGPLGINARASAYSIRKASFKLWCLMHMLENLIFLENTCSWGSQITTL